MINRNDRPGLSTAVAGVSMVVLLIIGAVVGYYLGTSGAAPQTGTITTTVPGGVVTVTSTITNTGSASTTSSSTISSQSSATHSSSSSSPSLSSTSSTTGAASSSSGSPCSNNATLLAAAKQEGTVVFYSSETVPELQALQNAFQADCPGISMQYVNVVSNAVAAKLTPEFTSGNHIADVILEPSATMSQFSNQSWLSPYTPSNSNLVPKNLWFNSNHSSSPSFFGVRIIYYVVAYNTNLVPASQVPHSWLDLTNPQWKGKIAIPDPNLAGSAIQMWAALQTSMSTSNFTALYTGVHAQGPQLLASADPVAPAIANGQVSLGITETSSMFASVKAGAPIAVAPVAPLVMLVSAVGMINGAPHPNAARLFENWALGPDAATVYQSNGVATPGANGLTPPPGFSSIASLMQTAPIAPTLSDAAAGALRTQMGLPWG